MEKQSIIFMSVALIVGLALGLLVGLSFDPNILSSKDMEIKREFVNELRTKGILPAAPESINDVYGKAKEIKDNELSIIIEERFDDPLGEFLPKTMIIKINEATEIFKFEEKSFDVFEQEQREFDEQMSQYGAEMPAELMPPDSFIKVIITLSDIKEDDFVSAFSENNIKGETEFIATSIQVEQMVELMEEIPAE
ncbi:hypothetical protein KJ591_01135 [Patescibacteria group bacterium]|nr:hypothetical protein [Patescibacteria group bacterium]